MNSLQELLQTVFEFVATCLWVFFWCAVAGVVCYLIWGVLKVWRRYLDDKHEAELMVEWARAQQRIAGAASDLDHSDRLQRELAEYYISERLP